MNKKVLVVEDNLDNQLYLNILFRRRNINIISVVDSNEVMTTFINNINNISLVMMDLRLPNINDYCGVDFTRKMLNIKYLPIIIQTASLSHREEAFAAGCVEYITKPFSKYQIDKIIDKYYRF